MDDSSTLFLGDLSVFCTEKDIRTLFRAFGTIDAIRIKRGSSGKANLSYGFIKFSDRQAAEQAYNELNGIMFLGRGLRIGWAEGKGGVKSLSEELLAPKKAETAQIHVSFISKQIDMLISETTLRSLFGVYGEVVDVALKKSQFDKTLRVQNGYGFVHFPFTPDGIRSALTAVQCLHQVTIDRVTYDCSISHALQQFLQLSENNSLIPQGFSHPELLVPREKKDSGAARRQQPYPAHQVDFMPHRSCAQPSQAYPVPTYSQPPQSIPYASTAQARGAGPGPGPYGFDYDHPYAMQQNAGRMMHASGGDSHAPYYPQHRGGPPPFANPYSSGGSVSSYSNQSTHSSALSATAMSHYSQQPHNPPSSASSASNSSYGGNKGWGSGVYREVEGLGYAPQPPQPPARGAGAGVYGYPYAEESMAAGYSARPASNASSSSSSPPPYHPSLSLSSSSTEFASSRNAGGVDAYPRPHYLGSGGGYNPSPNSHNTSMNSMDAFHHRMRQPSFSLPSPPPPSPHHPVAAALFGDVDGSLGRALGELSLYGGDGRGGGGSSGPGGQDRARLRFE
eukprot:gene24800-29965_t